MIVTTHRPLDSARLIRGRFTPAPERVKGDGIVRRRPGK